MGVEVLIVVLALLVGLLSGFLVGRSGKKVRYLGRYWEKEKYTAAIHEAGHAIVAWSSPYIKSIDTVNVDKGSGVIHHTMTYSSESEFKATWHEVAICFGGIAAELAVKGNFHSSQSKKDILLARENASNIIRGGCETEPPWKGMDHTDSMLDPGKVFKKGTLTIREKHVLRRGYARAYHIIHKHRKKVDVLAEMLLEKGKLEEGDVQRVLGSNLWIKICR